VDDRQVISWLHRRSGFGLTPAELDLATGAGVDATVERLVDPDGQGVPAGPDPWAGLTFTADQLKPQAVAAIARWVAQMSATPRPFEDWLVWFWHGHFATAIEKVKSPEYMVGQLRLFRQAGLGGFAELLKAVTIDPAMLVWLDGRESTGKAPNENYGREVLELFTLGIGSYQEADVRAGARALTGWTVPKRAQPKPPRAGQAKKQPAGRAVRTGVYFLPGRHDQTPQTYLGQKGVHDLDTTVAAITSRPECARFVSSRLASAVIGPVNRSDLDRLAARFTASGLELRDLARGVLSLGVDLARRDAVQPVVLAPVPWLASALHQTGVTLNGAQTVALLAAAGQVPMNPPSVGGWPSGAAWFNSATVAARYDLASLIATATTADHQARVAAAAGDHGALAAALNRPGGFSPETTAALSDARRVKGPAGAAPLALALVSPEVVLA